MHLPRAARSMPGRFYLRLRCAIDSITCAAVLFEALFTGVVFCMGQMPYKSGRHLTRVVKSTGACVRRRCFDRCGEIALEDFTRRRGEETRRDTKYTKISSARVARRDSQCPSCLLCALWVTPLCSPRLCAQNLGDERHEAAAFFDERGDHRNTFARLHVGENVRPSAAHALGVGIHDA